MNLMKNSIIQTCNPAPMRKLNQLWHQNSQMESQWKLSVSNLKIKVKNS